MDKILKNMLHRSEMVLGRPAVAGLAGARAILFGVGGVGSWCAESLVRSGLGHLTVVDSDIICATNINRQLEATSLNVGRPKADEMRKRLLDINPRADVVAVNRAYEAESAEEFDLGSFDYAIDAIDSLKNKLLLIERAQAAGTVLFSSMGAAAKVDPTKIKIGRLADTTVCPLAYQVRHALRKRGVGQDFLCVYSTEANREPQSASICGTGECTCTLDRAKGAQAAGRELPDWCARKRRINGSLPHVTAVFGFMLAGLVVQDQLARHPNVVT